MSSFAAIVSAFQNTYTDCDLATATQLLNDIDEEILSVIPYRKSTVYLGLTNGVSQYDADESVIKVWDAALLNPDGTYECLDQRGESELDFKSQGWRGMTPGATPFVFGFTENMTTGRYMLVPAPNYTTLLVSSITATSPPVVTTTTPHGLTAGNHIQLQNATGTMLRGSYYISTGGGNQFGLYFDAGLTQPVPASGVGTAGIVGTTLNRIVVLNCTQRLTSLTSTSAMPLGPQLRRLYADGMRWLWALQKHMDNAAMLGQQFERDLGLSLDIWDRRAADVPIEIKSFTQNMNYRSGGSGRRWTRSELGPN